MSFRGGLVLVALLAGCSSGEAGSSAPPAPADGGSAADTITVHTRTPSDASGRGTNATWAAALDAAGQWQKLEPSATAGTYTFAAPGATWSAAFACADDRASLVVVVSRPSSVTTFDVELEPQCAPDEISSFDMTGTFAHVPPTTSWLDFGYALDDRGFTIPAAGDNASYELLNVIAGTWDLGFGLRDEGGAPLTKIMLLRDQAIVGPTKLDVDATTAGLVPVPKGLVVNGVAPDENFAITARYALGGGVHGLDIGPQDVPYGQPTVTLTYVTVPPAAARPADRHRIQALAADADKETRVMTRTSDAVFHSAIDVALELPAGLPAPRAERTAPAPYVRVTTYVATRPNAADYEALVVGRVSNRRVHSWRLSVDASAVTGPEAVLAIPDFGAAPGFDASWAIGADVEAVVTGTVHEVSTPIGDGAVVRAATHAITLAP
ncbi:MAG: hypothetical protein KIT84_29340 [Labilithrix sp.]|nr:hypothetical protein [Labilithrix sp.]MCW5815167.1 hypothetical protein [Labilithrix sp.]